MANASHLSISNNQGELKMSYQANITIKAGFIEAMYFADGTDADFKDDEGQYLDGLFNRDFELSENANKNIWSIIESVSDKLPSEVYEKLTLGRIGNCIYYEVQGHGTGFNDEELTDETKEEIFQLFQNTFHLEIYDNDENKEIELSYSYNFR